VPLSSWDHYTSTNGSALSAIDVEGYRNFLSTYKQSFNDQLTNASGASISFDNYPFVHDQGKYGGFFGIVTIYDLVEQLVGELEETDEEEVIQRDPDTWEVTGLLPLKEAQEQFGIELPVDEYDTFGGFVFSIYGSIPDDGETFELETHSLQISVKQIAEHRLEKATVRVIREETEEESEEKGLFKKNKEKSEE
jgi:hypothetical protein